MAEFSVWGGVSLTMLLFLLAIISSTSLLVGAISTVHEHHVTGHSIVAVALTLILAAVNFFSVHRAGLSVAKITRGKPEAVQGRYGKVFSLVILVWTVCAGFFGSWIVRLVGSLL